MRSGEKRFEPLRLPLSSRGDKGPNPLEAGTPDHTARASASGHAGGMKAISRRLSEATPPETTPKHHASQRDASMSGLCKRMRGLLPSLRDGAVLGRVPVGSLTLNHRLIAMMPPASRAHNRRLVMPPASRVVDPFAITPISTIMLALDCRLAAPMVTALFARNHRPAAETFALSHSSSLRVWRAREFRPQHFPPANLPSN